MLGLVLLACVALSQGAKLSEADRAKLMDDLIDADLQKEIEKVVDTLDASELDALEEILSKPLDRASELHMIHHELQELGMDGQDVEDMFDLSDMMMKFLQKIPDIEDKLELDDDEYTLEDHCKLYLLGLPNKLGPLGFLALHSILESAGEAVADVQIGEFEPTVVDVNDDEAFVLPEIKVKVKEDTGASLTPLGDLFTRKRRELEEKAHMTKAAQMAKNAAMAAKSAADVAAKAKAAAMASKARAAESVRSEPEDIVSEILARRRRAVDGNRK